MSTDNHLASATEMPPQPQENALWKRAIVDWLHRDWPAFVLFTLLTLLAAYPILPHLRNYVLGKADTDNVQYVYMTGWVAKALHTGHSPFIDPHLNYPGTLQLAATDAPFLMMILVAPLTWLFGPVSGYSSITLFGSWLSGYFTYLWLRSVTGSRFAGMIAGMAFLLCPYRIYHSYGHAQLVSTQFFPFFFWTLHSALTAPRFTRRSLLLLSGATFLVGCMSQYYLVMCLLLSVPYALLLRWPYAGDLLRQGWKPLGAILIGAGVSAIPYLMLLGHSTFRSYNLNDARQYNAEFTDFLLPSHFSLIGQAIDDWMKHVTYLRKEQTVYLGLIALLLADVSLRWKSSPYRKMLQTWAGTAGIALVLAMGTDLFILHQPIFGVHTFWLPASLLIKLPFVSLIRVWSRFGIVVMLFVALLAGIGAFRLVQNRPQQRYAVMVVCFLLLLLDLMPGHLTAVPLTPRPVDNWLARQPGDFAVATLPVMRLEAQNYRDMYGSLNHGKRMPAFNHPQHRPPEYERFARIASRFPDPAALVTLRAMHFRYLLLVEKNFDGQEGRPTWETIQKELRQNKALPVVTEQAGVTVVKL